MAQLFSLGGSERMNDPNNIFLRIVFRRLVGEERYYAMYRTIYPLVVIPFTLTFLGCIAGVVYIFYWIIRELSLEADYKAKYGAAWQVEFERIHGTVSHAHARIAACLICMILLAAVLFVVYRYFVHKSARKSHDFAA